MKNILIATDLTSQSNNAFRRAVQIAQIAGAKLNVLHVTFQPFISSLVNKTGENHDKIRKNIVDCIEEYSGEKTLNYEIHIADRGRVYDRINEYARRLSVDVIVIGRGGHPQNSTKLAFSIGERVVSQASSQVLVVGNVVAETYKHFLVMANIFHYPARMMRTIRALGTTPKPTLLLRAPEKPEMPRFILKLCELFYGAVCRRFIKLASIDLNMPETDITTSQVRNFDVATLAIQIEQEKSEVIVIDNKLAFSSASEINNNICDLLYRVSCDILFSREVVK
ncbi:universal stress protein [Emcibacter sp.]|uniref:universal stress protein n=1 Tax=Emcibacter sp. TaxID=1979954 RepID=UPI003A92CB3F